MFNDITKMNKFQNLSALEELTRKITQPSCFSVDSIYFSVIYKSRRTNLTCLWSFVALKAKTPQAFIITKIKYKIK